ncbi:hypothetical protein [uncultured Chitinophaga sp.]|jgi:hypothetical protein|uniref:hypothetical protein n=1 Tax=uncultured Chitinophaga sp. TaxID=339340 RepID=UPI00261E85EB|nr:hypothetical protein [uncultured Chitinophaga sp.]
MKTKTLLFLLLAPMSVMAQKITADSIAIGVTTPLERLHVQGGRIYLNSAHSINGWNYSYFHWIGHSLVMGSRPGAFSHNAVELRPGGSNIGPTSSRLSLFSAPKQDSIVLKIQLYSDGNSFFNSGNVGIGTATPTEKLDIAGSLGHIQFQASGARIAFTRNNANYLDAVTPGGFLIFSTNGSVERVRIDANGNVGIGTNNPQAKLAVNGDIFSKRLKVVQTGWADYVFTPEYSLLPLHELENYIKCNQHLPDIPSAAEIERNGLDVGEMNRRLLQKVEELTLYIIDLKKEIDELKNAKNSEHWNE